ncbi:MULTISPECIES: hypothetical protein [unclassified Azospirillum]|uniref:hypothetical protein n=1 Tax=unclassified Azospirillum TaxID=2630922 RepID=UPI000B62941B|nr:MULTISPECIES: hypothetical protein [unclassified Azospirillum]SNS83568.1 hypothetical protein SAMN05880556_11315 [Azospirillum sp. RU38E]SNT00720.1 hypothetical protein SAMN05880591_11314 [Azospirillum sp. RU37A]
MAAGQYDITVEQGTTFALQIAVKSRNLSGATTARNLVGMTGRGQMRRKYSDPEIAAAFSVTIPDPAGGIVAVGLTAEQTAGLLAKPHVYDIELVSPDGAVMRLVQGAATVTPEVTK